MNTDFVHERESGHEYDPLEEQLSVIDPKNEFKFPDTSNDVVEVTPKTIVYIIVVTMILMLTFLLILIWIFNFGDDKSKEKQKHLNGNCSFNQQHNYNNPKVMNVDTTNSVGIYGQVPVQQPSSPSNMWNNKNLRQRAHVGASNNQMHHFNPNIQQPTGSGDMSGLPRPHAAPSNPIAPTGGIANFNGTYPQWEDLDVATAAITAKASSAAAAATTAASQMFQYANIPYSHLIPKVPVNAINAMHTALQPHMLGSPLPARPAAVNNQNSSNTSSADSKSSNTTVILNASSNSSGSIVGGLKGSAPIINILRGTSMNNCTADTSNSNSNSNDSDIADHDPLASQETAPLNFIPLCGDVKVDLDADSDASLNNNVVNRKNRENSGEVSQLEDDLKVSSLPSLQIKELALDHVLGGGAFGQVWAGTWRGTPVAVKVLSGALQKENMPYVELKAFIDEVQMLAHLRHPNICLFMGVCIDPPNRSIVTELVSRGSLWDVLRTPNVFDDSDSQHWPMWAISKVLDGTCKGLIYLHSNKPQPIIHRDLKSANILLDDSFNVKICDFGLARLRDFSTQMTANVGTVQWMAPEVLMGKAYTETADIYSLGIIAWELFTRKCPFDGLGQMEIAIQVTQKKLRPVIPTCCTVKQTKFMQKCWTTVPSDRYSALECLPAIHECFATSNRDK